MREFWPITQQDAAIVLEEIAAGKCIVDEDYLEFLQAVASGEKTFPGEFQEPDEDNGNGKKKKKKSSL